MNRALFMQLSERVKNELANMGRGALKLRGQHFLISETVLDRIVNVSDVKAGDRVLEIGPGLGFLTERLVATGAAVTVVELDEAFADHLEQQLGDRIALLRGDALRIDFTKLFDGKPFRVIANIPYNITSKLLEQIVAHADRIESATLLVQKEVAERVAAKPGEMNMLALIVQSAFDARVGFAVPAGAFLPPPKVESAVLRLTPRSGTVPVARGQSLDRAFLQLARRAFDAPRKKISTTLKLSKEQFAKAKLTGDERPSELTAMHWQAIHRAK